MNSNLHSLCSSQMNLINSTTWLSSKRQLSSSVKLPKREKEMLFTPPLPLKWLPSSRSSGYRLLQCSVLQATTITQVVVDSPTHSTQAFSPSLGSKLQDQVVLIIGLFQKLLATSVLRRVTMPTSVPTQGAFRLLHLSAMLLSNTIPSMQE